MRLLEGVGAVDGPHVGTSEKEYCVGEAEGPSVGIHEGDAVGTVDGLSVGMSDEGN